MSDDVTKGIEAWKKTGHGIDPNQIGFRHYDDGDCECLICRLIDGG
jgi:hypothetical protein